MLPNEQSWAPRLLSIIKISRFTQTSFSQSFRWFVVTLYSFCSHWDTTQSLRFVYNFLLEVTSVFLYFDDLISLLCLCDTCLFCCVFIRTATCYPVPIRKERRWVRGLWTLVLCVICRDTVSDCRDVTF